MSSAGKSLIVLTVGLLVLPTLPDLDGVDDGFEVAWNQGTGEDRRALRFQFRFGFVGYT